jgi:hypothetical protein
VFCASDLNTTSEIKERLEIRIGIAHSDTDESFPLVVLDELEGGSPLFPLLDKQVERESSAEHVCFCEAFG